MCRLLTCPYANMERVVWMQTMIRSVTDQRKAAAIIFIIVILAVTSFLNFLLFHTLVELFCILVAFGIVSIAVHTKTMTQDNSDYLTFFGISYFFIAVYDLIHTLAYKGMGVFPGDTSNLATQLWIIPRYIEALTFLAVPFLVTRSFKTKIYWVIPVISVILFVAVFTGVFPDCFIPGTGLTPFKKISEYIISATLLVAGLLMFQRKQYFDKEVLLYMLLACATTIMAELSFTFYVSVYGLSNMIGHLWKFISYYLIYEIMIRKKLLEPYEIIKDLYQTMERKVATRTRELEAANIRLQEGQKVLTQLNQKLGESNRLKSEFMATITHELRTPLTSVVAFCELMLDEVPGPINNDQRDNLLDIKTGAQQLTILINDILDMAKHEAGQLRVTKEEVDLNDVFRVVRRTMSAIAHQNDITLDIHKVNLPLVYGDPERIRQIIINLVSNSIKFTKEGGRIDVSARAEGSYAAIEVRDTGEGIPPELLPHIFEKFRQGDASMSRRRSGTGLGLALVRTLTELQNGRVSVTSETGKGTQFAVYLPFVTREEESNGFLHSISTL